MSLRNRGLFGVFIVVGLQGRGKSKNVFQDAFKWKQKNPFGIIISNMPYDFVDIHFSSRSDFLELIGHLNRYLIDTNDPDLLKRNSLFPPIYFILDEAQVYIGARDFKNFPETFASILTQCRKRSVLIKFITQDRAQIDVFVKRLSLECIRYEVGPLRLQDEVFYYMDSPEDNVIIPPTDYFRGNCFIEKSRLIMPDRWQKLNDRSLQNYFDQRWITNYMVGFENLYRWSYKDFFDFIMQKQKELIEDKTKSGLFGDRIRALFKNISFISKFRDNDTIRTGFFDIKRDEEDRREEDI